MKKKKITIGVFLTILLVAAAYIGIFTDILKPSEVNRDPTFIVSTEDQSGGIAANIINLGAQQRHINDEVKIYLNEVLKPHNGKTIEISFAMGDSESSSFASEIIKYLTSEKWTVEGPSSIMFATPKKGIVFPPNDSNEVFRLHVGHNN